VDFDFRAVFVFLGVFNSFFSSNIMVFRLNFLSSLDYISNFDCDSHLLMVNHCFCEFSTLDGATANNYFQITKLWN
jgi:hypothetical protein